MKILDIENLKKILASSITTDKLVNSKNRPASVLIIIFGREPMVLMTERSKTLNLHAGEISFPGGKWQEKDTDLLGTAIRETKEELGIEISRSMIIGQLDPVTTLNSGFEIASYITILDELPNVVSNSEISSILKIPLFSLLDTIEDDKDPSHKSIMEMYSFKFENHLIWGASARMLNQILCKLSSFN